MYVPDVKKVLRLHAELIVIDYEGSVFDACNLAFLGSLLNLRIPSYSLKDDELVVDYGIPFPLALLVEQSRKLTLSEVPISVTFGFFDDFEVMDPNVFEEDLIDDTFSVILGMNNRILSIIKPGGKCVSDEILNSLCDKAKDRYNHLYSVIEEFKATL